MSIWRKVKERDIDIEGDDKEVSFFIHYDVERSGNVYLSLSFDQIKDIAAKIAVIEK